MTTTFFPRKIRFTTLESLEFHDNDEDGRPDRRSLVRRGEERVAVISQCALWLKPMEAQHSRTRTDLIMER
jgi:hypothetical protein